MPEINTQPKISESTERAERGGICSITEKRAHETSGDLTSFFKKNAQHLFNTALFVFFAVLCVKSLYLNHIKPWQIDYVGVSFVIQNFIFAGLLLIRRQHQAVNKNIWDQTVALIAFCSGALIMDQPNEATGLALTASQIVTFMANVLGALCMLNLGRSFGILIALRKVVSTGVYGVVRHPMYLSDILLRVGFLVSHFNLFTFCVVAGSSLFYVYRALLEERFLKQEHAYAAYMQRVKYRFIPFVF
ncbi:MAG: isoprenylcysteine carboxylmethyltransferase family protein [Deltaproteobacteria bacterium]|nr:isoprenylcysteine carboxylmethyltransferase family protein [Deltaproteobacteria bacterium]